MISPPPGLFGLIQPPMTAMPGSLLNTNQLYMTYRVASFDVGIKHMCICIVDYNSNSKNFAIQRWSIISLKGKNIADYTRDLISKLKLERFGLVDAVLIEQQVNRNTQMKVLSHIIQSFFLCHERIPAENIHFVSPKLRVHNSNQPYNQVVGQVREGLGLVEPYSRQEFKLMSVALVDRILMEKKDKWIDTFRSNTKKDDLADSFLQSYSWYKEKGLESDDILMIDINDY